MRILQVDDTLTLEGGVGQYVAALVELLARGGHESITVRCRGAEHAGGYRVDYTLAGHDAAARLQDIVRRERPDVALVHHVAERRGDQRPDLCAADRRLRPRLSGALPWPGQILPPRRRDLPAGLWLGLLSDALPAALLGGAQPAHGATADGGHAALAGGASPGATTPGRVALHGALLAQNGFDPARITILPPHFIAAQPAPWTPPADPDQILYAGRLEIEKGVPYLLEALALLPRRYHLVIAGDGTLRAVYEQMTARLGLSDRVRFLGWCNQAAMPALYRQSGLLALPTICPESFGKVGIEAMAEGRPVVAFDSGGVSDWLHDGETGLLVRTRKAAALAQALEAILSDPVGAERMGRAAQEGRRDGLRPRESCLAPARCS